MSAWIVSKGHIDCLVQAALNEGLIRFVDADKYGLVLWAENHISVNTRYREQTPVPEYHFTGTDEDLDDRIVLAQVRCYDYQTCEHEGYVKSYAYSFVEALQEKLQGRIGERVGSVDRDDNIPWGIDDISEAVAR